MFAYISVGKGPDGSGGKVRQHLVELGEDQAWIEVDITSVLRCEGAYGVRFSPDNEFLSFIHPDAQEGIWACQRSGGKWSAPAPLPYPVNTDGREANHMFTRDGTLYFVANNRLMEEAGFRTCADLFRAEPSNGSYTSVEKLPFCTWFDEEHFFVAPDESYVIFSSQRRNAYGWNELLYGDYDLFISFRHGPGFWTRPRILGPAINTEGAEVDPFVTADGRYFFFSRYNSTAADIYWMDADFIAQLKSDVGRKQELLVAPEPSTTR